MEKELRVLMIEDVSHDAELEIRELKRAGLRVTHRLVETEQAFRDALRDFQPELIISDFSMPNFDGMFALALARELAPDVPFIFVSGTIGEEYAIRALRNGATDYVLKNNLVRLPAAVERARRGAQEAAGRRRAEAQLHLQGTALDVAANAIVITRRDGTISWVNRAFSTLTGYSAEEAIGQNPRMLNSGQQGPEFYRQMYDTILGGSVWRGEVVNRYKDGRLGTEEMTVTPVRGEGGEITHFIAIKQDITARKEAEKHRARLSAILEASPDFVATSDPEGNVLYLNRAARRMLELPEDIDPSQVRINDTHPRWAADMVLERGLPEAIRDGVWEGETAFLTSGGREIPVIQVIVAHKGPDGRLEFLSTIAHDISRRKNQELKIARLSRIQAVLSGINSAIVRIRDRQQLFEEACRIAVEHGGFGIAWVGLIDPGNLAINPVATAGVDADPFLAHSQNSANPEAPLGGGIIGRAVREKRAVFSNDLLTEPSSGGARRQEALRRGYRSIIGLPLLVGGTVVASLSLFAKEPNFFDDEEIKLLNELAGDISFALENMARQQQLEKLSRIRAVSSEINAAIVRIHDRETLLRDTCRIATEYGKFDLVWVALLDESKKEVIPVVWSGFSPGAASAATWKAIDSARGTLGEAIRTRKTAFRNDIEIGLPGGELKREALNKGCRSAVSLPFVVDGKVVALATLFAAGTGFFDQDEIALLDEVAADVSFALKNMARQQQIEKLSRIRTVSGEINAAIVRIHEREVLLREACRIATEHGKFEMVWIGIVDAEKREIRATAWTGFSPEIANRVSWKSVTAAQGTLAEAILTRKPAVRNDIEAELAAGGMRNEALARGCRSTVCLPLVVDDDVVALVVLFATGKGFFDEDELALLNELAADISFALQSISRQEKVEYLSYYDALTGLPNRQLFMDRVSQQMRARGGEQRMVALILFDLERFRNINDTLGRRGGDELLMLIARRLESAFNGKDYLAHIGGDHFGAVIRGMRDAAEIAHAVESQILACFREPFAVDGQELRAAPRAGVALFPGDGTDADTLFRNAEAALKKTKASGEHYLFYAPQMNARVAEQMKLENDLHHALAREQFILHYQPKFDLSSGRMVGMEALIRWNHPERGLVPPGSFVSVLEETGKIIEVGSWALRRAALEHAAWSAAGLTPPRIAVNVSPAQLRRKDFVDYVKDALAGVAGAADRIDIEITESMLMDDIEGSIVKLKAVQSLGLNVAIDDFGTGYSSLSYLARLPINSLKIDRSFIIQMNKSPEQMAIVSAVISLARTLNLKVVAEGVETEEQASLLRLLRCDEAQGYLFSRPLAPEELEKLLRKQ